MAQTETLNFKNQNNKPTLVIFDEVDGALESESHGAINALLDFIFKGTTTSNKNKDLANAAKFSSKK